jgi:hypothetical protein
VKAATSACREQLAGECSGPARAALACAATNAKCGPDEKTDVAALLADCKAEQAALTECLAPTPNEPEPTGDGGDTSTGAGGDGGTPEGSGGGGALGGDGGAGAGNGGAFGGEGGGGAGDLPPARLYGLMGSRLVVFDETTAKPTLIGELSATAVPTLLAFDSGASKLYAVRSILDAPELIEVNPCTGAVTAIAPLTIAGGVVHFVEGIASLNGVLYASASLDAACCQDTTSESLVTIHPTTGVATLVGNATGTVQNDYDHLAASDGALLTLDADYLDGSLLHLYQVDTTTGAATHKADAAHHVSAMSAGPDDGTVYAWVLSGSLAHQLVVIDAESGDVTPIGVTDSAGQLGSADVQALQLVEASCE